MKHRIKLAFGIASCILVGCAAGHAGGFAQQSQAPQAQAAGPSGGPSGSQSGGSQPGAPDGGKAAADAQEYKNYRLNMDNVNKYVSASKAIIKVMHDNPTLQKEMESQKDVPTIDEAVRTTEKYPDVSAAIESAGFSTREYVVISGTLMGVTMAVGMKKQGQLKAYPTTILPENLAFVEKNYDKLNAMMKSLREAAGDVQ